jgi:hypothetical protein
MRLTKSLTIVAGITGALALVAAEVADDPGGSMVFLFSAGSLVMGGIVASVLRVGREPFCRLGLPPGPPPSPQEVREAA